MSLLNDEVKGQVKEELGELKEDVTLITFTKKENCQFCNDTAQLVKEVSEVNAKIKVEVYDIDENPDKASQYKVDKAPTIIPLDKKMKDFNIRFYGIPGGYEFMSLIETIKMIGTNNSGLSEELKNEVKSIDKEVQLDVFITLSCPYCPRSVIAAHKFAFENDNIKSAMVEAQEFPEWANKFDVMAVPKTVINEGHSFEGAMPEDMVIQEIKKAI